jgi:hypothetical protein
MFLIRNIEDPRFVEQLNGLDNHNQFIHELASVILPGGDGFESVFSLANRVYDRHYKLRPAPAARSLMSHGGFDQLQIPLSA